MNLKTFMLIGALIAGLYGLGFLLIPAYLNQLYAGPAAGPEELGVVLGYRYFGVALMAIAAIFFLARESNDWPALRALLIGGAISDVIGAIVSAWGTTTGILNALGWSVVLIYVALFAGSVYFLRLGDR